MYFQSMLYAKLNTLKKSPALSKGNTCKTLQTLAVINSLPSTFNKNKFKYSADNA